MKTPHNMTDEPSGYSRNRVSDKQASPESKHKRSWTMTEEVSKIISKICEINIQNM